MGLMDLFKRQKTEQRSFNTGYTAQVMDARHNYITGQRGLAELTAAVQTCVSLWENGLSQAVVNGTDLLTPSMRGIAARGLALRGEALFVLDAEGLIPVSDWTVSTRDGMPRAYKVTIPDTGGGRTKTVLAGEVLHFTTGTDAVTPWAGQSPLRRASLSADLLYAVESALAGAYEDAPLGSQIAPFPESDDVDREKLARSFRGQRGRVLLKESVNVEAAGGPTPQTDWKTSDLSPDLQRSMAFESWQAAQNTICQAYGVMPAMLSPAATGPVIREAQRHLAQWQLQPLAGGMAQEASEKLDSTITLDTLQPVQAYDSGNRANAMKGIIEGFAMAKQSGLSDEQINAAMQFTGVPDSDE